MRIAFYTPRCLPDNSHGRYVIELARHMVLQHSVTICSGSIARDLPAVVVRRRLAVPYRPMVAQLAALWIQSLAAFPRRHFDVVHAQGADAPVGNVVTAHYCTQASIAAKDAATGTRRLNERLGTVLERYCLTKPSTRVVIAVSHRLKHEIQHHYGADPEKVIVIHPGVDLQYFHPANRQRWRNQVRSSLGLNDSDFVVLFVGGDYSSKGLPRLLDAVATLPARPTVLVVGGARKVDTSHRNIVYVGVTADVARFYAAADCFALPTRYDTFSLATLEAMASGLPVLVSRVAGVTELLQHEHDAVLLDRPDDVDRLAAELARVATDDAHRRRLGANARLTAEQHSWARVADETLVAYRRAID